MVPFCTLRSPPIEGSPGESCRHILAQRAAQNVARRFCLSQVWKSLEISQQCAEPSHKCSQQPISHMGTQKLTDVVTLEAKSSRQNLRYIVNNCLELPSFQGTQLPTPELCAHSRVWTSTAVYDERALAQSHTTGIRPACGSSASCPSSPAQGPFTSSPFAPQVTEHLFINGMNAVPCSLRE